MQMTAFTEVFVQVVWTFLLRCHCDGKKRSQKDLHKRLATRFENVIDTEEVRVLSCLLNALHMLLHTLQLHGRRLQQSRRSANLE